MSRGQHGLMGAEEQKKVSRTYRAVPNFSSELSRFTWKEFLDLNNAEKSHATPLLVIAHVDVNAFFAQLEQLRLGLSSEDPVVCVQWSSLIAVSYAARKYGINRMDSLQSARAKCPHLVAAHTAVFKRGETHWTYSDAGVLPDPDTHKVSLDPYRRESRKMMRLFRSKCDKVEKASVDESFMDFGRLIFKRAQDLFPELRHPPTDLSSKLPILNSPWPEELANFEGEVILTEDGEAVDSNDRFVQDWDDVFILMGTQIALDIRDSIQRDLGYTTSCGISRTKTISKLASGFIKPDAQTVVRGSAVPRFCDSFEISDFWSMGGKVGKMVSLKLTTPMEGSIRYVRDNFTLEQMISRLDGSDATLANNLYAMVRGELYTPLNLRTDVKSMGSTKNFKPNSVRDYQDILKWMPVFCADILLRFLELDEESGIILDNSHLGKKTLRRPKTVSIHFRTAEYKSFSRQATIPLISSIEKVNEVVYNESCKLYRTVIDTWNEFAHGKLFPLSHFGIGVANFEEIDNSRTIDEFAAKSNGTDDSEIIGSLFAELNKSKVSRLQETLAKSFSKTVDIWDQMNSRRRKQLSERVESHSPDQNGVEQVNLGKDDPRFCPDCEKLIVDEDMTSHRDYHYALALSREVNRSDDDTLHSDGRTSSRESRKKKRKLDKGQTRLPFFKT